MQNNYSRLVTENLGKVFSGDQGELSADLPAQKEGGSYLFRAFGEECRLSPDGILVGDTPQNSVLGILISLYALNATPEACVTEPFRAFKELPDSMPYAGAFVTHTQQVLVPHVETLEGRVDKVVTAFNTDPAVPANGGDFSFRLQPLPKIWLEFICYLPDEDFPASVTCLYSHNADRFLTTDALADVGEYTVKKIITLL
ncbi:MAG: DUF3786 domain-containing protein [Desulfobacterales bacterium]|nr:DUF3786 domain-containing protein [Desulfobacterales bacterium]